METMSSNRKAFLSFLVGLLIGGGGAWLWLDRASTASVATNTKDQSASVGDLDTAALSADGTVATGVAATGEAGVDVGDQSAGTTIVLKSVTLPQTGWVAIHEDNSGVPGNILGAQRLDAGTTNLGNVTLLRGTTAGGTYYAMLHADNGDGAFDPHVDLPMLGADGKPVMMVFKAN